MRDRRLPSGEAALYVTGKLVSQAEHAVIEFHIVITLFPCLSALQL